MPVKTPTVLQMENVECGAASLAMILAHYRRYVPLEELRVVCGISRDGSKASNVVKAARHYGLTAKGLQTNPEALASVPLPAIVFWEFRHFVVLEGQTTRWGRPVVHVNDPAEGRRVLPAAEFDEGFTGVVLTMEPGPDFRPGGRRPGLLAGLAPRLRGIRGLLVLSTIASLLLMLLGITMPAFTRAFIDSVLLGGDSSILVPFFTMMAAIVAATFGITWLRQSYLVQARLASSTLSSSRFMRHLLRLPVGFFTQRSPADITHRMRSNDHVAEILSRDLSTAVIDALVVLLYAGLLWSYNAKLTVIGVAIALLNVVALRAVVRVRASGVKKLARDEANLLSVSYNGLQLIETMKATGGENEYFRKWAGHQAKALSGQQMLGAPSAMLSVVAPTLAALNSAAILLIGGLQAVQGAISIGLLVAFQTLMTSFSRPITQLTGLAGSVQDFGVEVLRLRDVENYPAEDLDRVPEPERAGRLDGRVVFDEVTFGYNPLGTALLDRFSFSVGPGEQVALVGGSGSGKSTATRLISGLYRPWSGQVLIDGVPREEIPRSVLAASVAFVDQEIFLFEGTVRDNVTLWDPSVPDEAVIAALKDAAVYDVVSARRGGLNSGIAEDGRNFSGGQRQRLEIARALVRNPERAGAGRGDERAGRRDRAASSPRTSGAVAARAS